MQTIHSKLELAKLKWDKEFPLLIEEYVLLLENKDINLSFVPKELRTEEICLIAVKQDGYALYNVPEELKTEELCLIACKQDGYALYNVPKELRTEEICLEAVKQDDNALYWVPEELRDKIRSLSLCQK